MARTQWETDVSARRKVRVGLDAIIKSTDPSEREALRKLEEARGRLNSNRRLLAENAIGDLGLAAERARDPALKQLIKAFLQEIDVLLYGSPS